MAHRVMGQRIRLRLPWYYTVAIVMIGVVITGLFARSDFLADRSRDDALNSEIAAGIAVDLGTRVGEFYTPTVAGEGYVAASVDEARILDVTDSQVIGASFASFVAPIVDYLGPALLDYQLAPAGIVTYSARPERNAAALGHNLFVDDARRDDILRTVQARKPIVSGPVTLRQGGLGLIIRQAVFVPGIAPFEERYAEVSGDPASYEWMAQVPDDFWGFATTVVDFSALLEQVDFRGVGPDEIAIRPIAADGVIGESFFGDLSPDSGHIMAQTIILPDGSLWLIQIGIVRTALWQLWPILLVGTLVTVLVSFIIARGYRIRQRDRLGLEFSRRNAHATEREQVLQNTAEVLVKVVPSARGTLRTADDQSHWSFPEGTEEQAESSALSRTWQVAYGDEAEAFIEVVSPRRRAERRIDEAISAIGFLMASALAGLLHRERLEELSTVDHLTELFNRRQFQPSFESLTRIAQERGMTIGIGVVDVDDFKTVNDSHGHLFGDEVLRTLGTALEDAVRGEDSVFRFGGDEFVILSLLPGEVEGVSFFHRVHDQATASLAALTTQGNPVTVSIGYVLSFGEGVEPMNELLAKADQALYRAKAAGRHRVVGWTAQGTDTAETAGIDSN